MKKDLPSSGKEIGQRALSRLSKDKDFAGKEIDRGIWPMKKGDRTRKSFLARLKQSHISRQLQGMENYLTKLLLLPTLPWKVRGKSRWKSSKPITRWGQAYLNKKEAMAIQAVSISL